MANARAVGQSRGMEPVYDHIGGNYQKTRSTDPRIAAAILAALGDARSVVNIGAGTGAYEPTDREVVAVEPSATMIAQRPAGAAPAVQAFAEALPLADQSVDAAMAVNTVHHWNDVRAGMREIRRVARKRFVIFLREGADGTPFWLEGYFPALSRVPRVSAIVATIREEFPALRVHRMPLPRDCADGVFTAYWGRPERYLDPQVRANISNFALASVADVNDGLARLEEDLASGEWDRKYGELRTLPALDLGHRLLVGELET